MLGHGPLSERPLSDVAAGAAGGSDNTTPLVSRRIKSDTQNLSYVREAIGYAVTFGALAALLSGTPQSVGAADYTVGTHQAVIADTQSHGRIWGTPPQLIPSAAAPAPIGKTLVAAPQQVDVGQAWIWHPSNLQPPDPIGGVTYTVGSHQSVVADSQSHGKVWGTSPSLFTAGGTDIPIGRTFVIAPQQMDVGQAWVWHSAIPDAPVVSVFVGKTLVSAPQQIDSGQAWLWHPSNVQPPDPVGGVTYNVGSHQAVIADSQSHGKVWGTTPALFVAPGTDTPVGKTLVAAPEQVPSGSASVWGTDVPSVAGTDKPIARTWISAPEQIDSGSASIWGTDVAAGEVLISTRNVFGGQDSPEQSGGGVWGQRSAVGAPVAGTDKPVGVFRASAPEQQPHGAATLWGQRIAQDAPAEQTTISRNYSISQDSTEQLGTSLWGQSLALYRPPDPTIGRTLVAAPEQQPYGQAWVWGTKREYVFGTDTRVGTFIQAIEAFYEPVQKGLILTPSADLIPPPVVVPPADTVQTPAGRHRKRTRYLIRVDGQTFWVEDEKQAQVLLERVTALAPEAADAAAAKLGEKIKSAQRLRPVSLRTPKIVVSPEITHLAERAERKIAEVYKSKSMDLEIKLLLHRKMQQDDDDAAITLILLN